MVISHNQSNDNVFHQYRYCNFVAVIVIASVVAHDLDHLKDSSSHPKLTLAVLFKLISKANNNNRTPLLKKQASSHPL